MDYCLLLLLLLFLGSSYDNEKAGTESLYCMALRYVLYYVYQKCKDASDPVVDAGVQVVHVKLD